MSLVGPRPIVVAEVSRYGSRFHDYCTCRPGITGLWQVSGRNDVTYRRQGGHRHPVYARTAFAAHWMSPFLRAPSLPC